MGENKISCVLNDSTKNISESLLEFAGLKIAKKVIKFHQSLPDYKPTPLVNLSHFANKLGIKQLTIKDESHRFNLNAFKVLGASYAIAQHLSDFLNLKDDELEFDKIICHKNRYKDITLATATDGNHGRAVAFCAKLFGCKAVVYMPKGSSKTRLKAIQSYGAVATITTLNYDDTVIYAKEQAQKNGQILLQDTAWDGYQKVPSDIMQGYFTLITEDIKYHQNNWPTHVFLQAGVGSLAASIVAYMTSFKDKATPKFIVVEPNGAKCFFESMQQQKPLKISGELPTIMAGLACGKPSNLAWQILKSTADAFLSCNDDITCHGMRALANPIKTDKKVISGESGAVTMGTLSQILTNKKYQNIKNDLELDHDSKVLLFSTEGDTDPENYCHIICS